MPPDPYNIAPEEVLRIERIIASIEELKFLTTGYNRNDLNTDVRTRRSILHALIEIGEGDSRLAPETRDLLPDIPWHQIIHMRNVLVHVYWGVNLDRIWDAAITHAPTLEIRLRSLIKPPT